MAMQIFDRLETIDNLIKSKRTGTPETLAKRLGISKRALYNFLEIMRRLGAPISYNKQRQTYYYTDDGGFQVRYKNYLEAS